LTEPSGVPGRFGGYDMTVERTHITHETRYVLRNGAALRCVLAFDWAGRRWSRGVEILLPGPGGTEDLYGTQEFPRPDAAQPTAWLTPTVGRDAASELAMADNADPPHAADYQPVTGR
jgi:hypothetical protein